MKVKFDLRNAERNYSRALTAMAALPGLNAKQIVKAEAGTILKTCAARTKIAPAGEITTGARLRALKALGLTRGDLTINAGVKATFGRVWSKGPTGKWDLLQGDNFSKMPRHVSDARWSTVANKVVDAKRTMAKVIPQAKAAAGLARRSWITIADKLGIKLEQVPGGGISPGAIAKARGAVARGNAQDRNGHAKEEEKATSYFVTLINRLPYGRRIGLDRTLLTVMAGRASYFSTAVRKGFTGSLEQVAKQFPGWTIK